MARPLRLEFAGALYHVTSRGDRREAIYETDEDRESYLSLLGEVCEIYHWHCHAYCLMTNHYHLLIETLEGNLSKGMRQLNGVYTQHFNRANSRVGHVFQGRYQAILVDKDHYLLELARYIVLNPVRAKMVRAAKEWRWSSYRATAGQQTRPSWLEVNGLLGRFGKRKSLAIKAYKRFIAQGKEQGSPWTALKKQIFLGDATFVEEMQRLIHKDKELSEVPSSQRRSVAKPLAHYAKKGLDRDDAIGRAYASGGYSMKEIGAYFSLHYSTVSRILTDAKHRT